MDDLAPAEAAASVGVDPVSGRGLFGEDASGQGFPRQVRFRPGSALIGQSVPWLAMACVWAAVSAVITSGCALQGARDAAKSQREGLNSTLPPLTSAQDEARLNILARTVARANGVAVDLACSDKPPEALTFGQDALYAMEDYLFGAVPASCEPLAERGLPPRVQYLYGEGYPVDTRQGNMRELLGGLDATTQWGGMTRFRGFRPGDGMVSSGEMAALWAKGYAEYLRGQCDALNVDAAPVDAVSMSSGQRAAWGSVLDCDALEEAWSHVMVIENERQEITRMAPERDPLAEIGGYHRGHYANVMRLPLPDVIRDQHVLVAAKGYDQLALSLESTPDGARDMPLAALKRVFFDLLLHHRVVFRDLPRALTHESDNAWAIDLVKPRGRAEMHENLWRRRLPDLPDFGHRVGAVQRVRVTFNDEGALIDESSYDNKVATVRFADNAHYLNTGLSGDPAGRDMEGDYRALYDVVARMTTAQLAQIGLVASEDAGQRLDFKVLETGPAACLLALAEHGVPEHGVAVEQGAVDEASDRVEACSRAVGEALNEINPIRMLMPQPTAESDWRSKWASTQNPCTNGGGYSTAAGTVGFQFGEVFREGLPGFWGVDASGADAEANADLTRALLQRLVALVAEEAFERNVRFLEVLGLQMHAGDARILDDAASPVDRDQAVLRVRAALWNAAPVSRGQVSSGQGAMWLWKEEQGGLVHAGGEDLAALDALDDDGLDVDRALAQARMAAWEMMAGAVYANGDVAPRTPLLTYYCLSAPDQGGVQVTGTSLGRRADAVEWMSHHYQWWVANQLLAWRPDAAMR